MTTTNESKKPHAHDRWEVAYTVPGRWVSFITQAVTAGVTRAVTAAVTVVVMLFVLLGGLWLAHSYLPTNVFNIIVAVLIADISLGIILRFVLSRK